MYYTREALFEYESVALLGTLYYQKKKYPFESSFKIPLLGTNGIVLGPVSF